MDDYARAKIQPFERYLGTELVGVELRADTEFEEPGILTLRFADSDGADLPELEISVWHGMGASGFVIEASS